MPDYLIAGAQVLLVETPVLHYLSTAEQGPPGPEGPEGPVGPSGSAGGSSYVHTQASALATWTAAHNLGRFPSVTVVDNLGQRIEPDVTYVDANTVQIYHGSARTGAAYLN